jgi:branched-chain amino acid transport system substrate-binding protein
VRRAAQMLAVVLLASAAGSCSLVVGSLSECQTTDDCASRGADLTCQDHLCVRTGSLDAGPGDAGPGDGGATDAGPDVLRDPHCQIVFGEPSDPTVLRLGAILSRSTPSGGVDPRGVPRQNALQLAVQQLNTKAALPNRKFAVRVCDDTGDSSRAATEAAELLGEGAVALVTSGSSQTLAVADVAVPAGAVVMSLSATATQITQAGQVPDGGAKRVWSTAISDQLQGRVLGGLVHRADGGAAARPACILQDDIAFNGLFSAVNAAVQARSDGGVSVQRFLFSTVADIPATVGRAIDAGPDVVLIIAPVSQSPDIFNAWTTAPDPAFIFSDNSRSTGVYAFDGGLRRLTGAEGTGPSTAAQASAEFSLFKDLYVAKFGADPTSQASYVPNAYDSVLLLGAGALWAQGKGEITGASVAQGLTELSDLNQTPVALTADNFTTLRNAFTQGKMVNVAGASGSLDFDSSTGTAPGPIDVWQIEPDGGIVTIQTVPNP